MQTDLSDSNVDYIEEIVLQDINETDDEVLVDFVRWFHYNYRDQCTRFWDKFREYLERGRR